MGRDRHQHLLSEALAVRSLGTSEARAVRGNGAHDGDILKKAKSMPTRRLGIPLTFTAVVEPDLGDLHTVVELWSPFPAGAYMVTWAYATPVNGRDAWIEDRDVHE